MDGHFPKTGLVLLLIGGLSLAGCNPGTGTDGSKPEKTAAAPTNNRVDQRLVGTWYGRAQLDMKRVEAFLESIDNSVERENLANVVRGFLTTEIGAQFDASGNMVLDMQMQPAGQPLLRDSTRGQWTVVDSTTDAVVIETVEPLPAGGTETNQVRYEFGQANNALRMVPPTSPWLAGCNPVFVFERIEDSMVQVANQPGGSDSVK